MLDPEDFRDAIAQGQADGDQAAAILRDSLGCQQALDGFARGLYAAVFELRAHGLARDTTASFLGSAFVVGLDAVQRAHEEVGE